MEAATAPTASHAVSRRPDPVLVLAVLGLLSLALWPIELDKAFGLPAHPLLIHLPVISIPLLALGLIAVAIRPVWLDRFGVALGALAVVSLAATLLAAGAGEAFRAGGEGGPGIADHAEAGETLRLVMIGVTAVVLAGLAVMRASRTWPRHVVRALFVVAAVAAGFFVIRTGHLGAEQTWGDRGGPPSGQGMPGAGQGMPGGGQGAAPDRN